MTTEQLLFWVFGAMTLLSALGVLVSKNPVGSAMSLVAAFFFLAGIYVLLWAHTIAILQVLVYAGAIMVLFLFVIMLLSLTDMGPASGWTVFHAIGAVASAGLTGLVVWALWKLPMSPAADLTPQAQTYGTLRELGRILYTQYLLPFEVVSLLLLAAIVGAVMVAKPRV